MFPTRTAVCIGDMKPWLVSLASILTHNASSFSLAVCVCGYSIGVCKQSETRRGKASYGKRHSMGRGVRENLDRTRTGVVKSASSSTAVDSSMVDAVADEAKQIMAAVSIMEWMILRVTNMLISILWPAQVCRV